MLFFVYAPGYTFVAYATDEKSRQKPTMIALTAESISYDEAVR